MHPPWLTEELAKMEICMCTVVQGSGGKFERTVLTSFWVFLICSQRNLAPGRAGQGLVDSDDYSGKWHSEAQLQRSAKLIPIEILVCTVLCPAMFYPKTLPEEAPRYL